MESILHCYSSHCILHVTFFNYISIYTPCLVYLVGPDIIELMDETQNEGGIASFICQAIGEPLPTINWYFNGAPLDESNTAKYMITERQISTTTNTDILNIMSVQSSDVGTYTCNATNVVSSDTSSGILTFNGELYIVIQLLRQFLKITVIANLIILIIHYQQYYVGSKILQQSYFITIVCVHHAIGLA